MMNHWSGGVEGKTLRPWKKNLKGSIVLRDPFLSIQNITYKLLVQEMFEISCLLLVFLFKVRASPHSVS